MAVRALNDAVGRIDSTLTGTGFIVDRAKGLIVTCKHVVRGKKTAQFTLQQLDFTVECTVEEAAAGQADWALLTAKKPLPANAAELKLYRFRWNGCKIPFTSYGFASLYPPRGGFLSGEVRGVVKDKDKNKLSIDAKADELIGKQHKDVLGQSGAPFLVNGMTVGLVWATLSEGAGSTLLVIPSDVLYEESARRIPLVDAVKLPYDDIFVSLLSQFSAATLRLAGRALTIDDSGSDDVYRERLAYAMIAGGLDATAKVLVRLLLITPPVARPLVVLAESLWIDGLAAQIASELSDSPLPRGLIWNATYDSTICELLQRACWHRHGTLPTWDGGNCLIVHGPTGESHGSGLVAQIDALFKTKLNKAPDEIKAYLGSTILSPVIAVIFDTVPSDELLAELEDHYPGLCVLFICAEAPQDLANVTLIEPQVEAKREYEAARVARERRDELQKHLKFTIEGKDLRP